MIGGQQDGEPIAEPRAQIAEERAQLVVHAEQQIHPLARASPGRVADVIDPGERKQEQIGLPSLPELHRVESGAGSAHHDGGRRRRGSQRAEEARRDFAFTDAMRK